MPSIDIDRAVEENEVNDIEENSTAKRHIENMEKEMEKICEILFSEIGEFNAEDAFNKIHDYLKKYDRLLYAVISNIIFQNASENDFGRLQTNIDKLLEYVWSENFQQKLEECSGNRNDRDRRYLLEKTKKVILKIHDHVNLARRQFLILKGTDEDNKRKLEESLAPFKAEVTKDMSSQLITLVGIFTALAFLVFGEMSSLSIVFTNIVEVSVFRLIIIGTVWALFLLNTIFVFMFCLQKFTNIDIRADKSADANIFQQYPIVWWSNLLILFVMTLSMWLYGCIHTNIGRILSIKIVLGSILIIIIFGVITNALYHLSKKNNT